MATLRFVRSWHLSIGNLGNEESRFRDTAPVIQSPMASHSAWASAHDTDTSTLDSDNDDDLPPAPYIASMVASSLLEQGPAMYNRKDDADCILVVGQQRFYVHVQILAARSPTFRRIFDDMIKNNAWQAASPTPSLVAIDDSTTAEAELTHPPHLSSQDEQACQPFMRQQQYERCSSTFNSTHAEPRSDPWTSASMSSHNSAVNTSRPMYPIERKSSQPLARHPMGATGHDTQRIGTMGIQEESDLQDSQSPLSNNEASIHQLQVQYAHMSLSPSNDVLHHDATPLSTQQQYNSSISQPHQYNEEHMDTEYNIDSDGDNIDEDDDDLDEDDGDEEFDDDFLPELTIDFTDPEGSHFDELLYWLYTNNGDRWLSFFTPINYRSILANILTLNIGDRHVLGLCERFEQCYPVESGLHGLAESHFRLAEPSMSRQ